MVLEREGDCLNYRLEFSLPFKSFLTSFKRWEKRWRTKIKIIQIITDVLKDSAAEKDDPQHDLVLPCAARGQALRSEAEVLVYT